jgi:hypothetical protein
MSGAYRAAGEGERSGALTARDRPISGRGRRGGCGLRGARVGQLGKEKVGRAEMNSRISDLFKSVLNKFKLI